MKMTKKRSNKMMERMTDLSQRSLINTRQAQHPSNNKFKKLRRPEVR